MVIEPKAQFMRRVIPFLAALALVSGCNWAGVRGDGVIVTTNVTVAEFSTLEANGAYKIEWSPGKPALSITTDSNLLPLITTTLSGNTLKIDQQQNLRPTRGITIVVSSATLKEVDLNGAVTLTASNVSGGEFKLEANGASSIRVAGSVTNLEVRFAGASSLNAKGLSAQTAHVSLSGASAADVTATETLDVSISGAGTVTYGGNPKKVNKDISGVGTIKAR
jgi:hypothetical protein